MSVTAVPIQPTPRRVLAMLWGGIVLALIAAVALAWAGTGAAVAQTGSNEQFLAWNARQPGVQLGFDLPSDMQVKLALYDIQGRLVRVLADESLTAGTYQREWDGRTESGHSAANGMYYAELRAGSKRITRSVSLTR